MAEKEDVLKKINEGVYQTSQRLGKSPVWAILADIRKEDGSILGDYVYCRKCHYILKHHGKQTSNLLRHKCFSGASEEDVTRKASRREKQIQPIIQDLDTIGWHQTNTSTVTASHIEQLDDTSQPIDTSNGHQTNNTTSHIHQSQLEDVSQPIDGDPLRLKIENETISSSEYDIPHMAASGMSQRQGRSTDRCSVFGELIAEHLRNLMPHDSIALESRLAHTLYEFLTDLAPPSQNRRLRRKRNLSPAE